MMRYFVKQTTQELGKVYQSILFAFGWKWFVNQTNFQYYDTYALCFDFSNKEISWSDERVENAKYKEINSPEELVKLLSKPPVIVKIGDYDVDFIENGTIKVGCQTISFDIIEKIYKEAKTKVKIL